MLNELKAIFIRDLDRLQQELLSFENEDFMWLKKAGISNSAGNLTLHIAGNLQHFIGHVLGKSDYKRDRDSEFTTRVSLEKLTEEIEKSKSAIALAFDTLNDNDLESQYPIEVFGQPMSVKFFLLHLSGHLNYHLGQINYYRRLN